MLHIYCWSSDDDDCDGEYDGDDDTDDDDVHGDKDDVHNVHDDDVFDETVECRMLHSATRNWVAPGLNIGPKQTFTNIRIIKIIVIFIILFIYKIEHRTKTNV